MATFSEHAREKMIDLYTNHAHEVGSQLKLAQPELYRDYKSTSCIDYVLNVLKYAFDKAGNRGAVGEVGRLGTHGTALAAYLVTRHSWKGVYINPDVSHPVDSDAEHAYSSVLAEKNCRYYGIPLEFKATNYRVTAPSHPPFRTVSARRGATPLSEVGYNALEKVRFGFGVSRGGQHTWLFSEGFVYEVHWDQVGAGLYEKTALRTFPWLSGAVVVPPEQAALLVGGARLTCAAP